MIAKLVLCFTTLAAIASAVELGDAEKAIIEKCRIKNNIEVEQIKNAVKNRKLPETENGKCFLQCVMEEGGVIKGDEIDVAHLKELCAKKYDDNPDIKAKAEQIIDACAKEVKKPDGKCEFGLEILKCTVKKREAMGLPPPQLEGY